MLFSVMCAGYSAIHCQELVVDEEELPNYFATRSALIISLSTLLRHFLVAFGGLKVEDLESAKRPNLGTLPDSIITVGFFYILKML